MKRFIAVSVPTPALVIGCGPSVIVEANSLAGGQTSSQTKYFAVVECACEGACASACGGPGPADCLAMWGGNPATDCTLCLSAPSGCVAEMDACIGDEGTSQVVDVSDNRP